MACQFCATGREGLTRNLTAAEVDLPKWLSSKRISKNG